MLNDGGVIRDWVDGAGVIGNMIRNLITNIEDLISEAKFIMNFKAGTISRIVIIFSEMECGPMVGDVHIGVKSQWNGWEGDGCHGYKT
jgi:hypothetical protein